MACLILDAELMATRLKLEPLSIGDANGMPRLTADRVMQLITDAISRIACSAWMTRCWTYQEGSLPTNRAFQFLDGMVIFGLERLYLLQTEISCHVGPRQCSAINGVGSLNQVRSQLGTELVFSHGGLHHGIPLMRCDCAATELVSYFHLIMDTRSLVHVWNELGARSTSLPRDVPFVMANILGLDNTALSRHERTEDMVQHILFSMPEIPLTMFFCTGQKIDAIGNHRNRWIPARMSTNMLEIGPDLKNLLSESVFTYDNWNYAKGRLSSEVDVYIADAVIPMGPGTLLQLDEQVTVVTLGQTQPIGDQLDLTRFNSTCIFVNLERHGVTSGACFYFHSGVINSHRPKNNLFKSFWKRTLLTPFKSSRPSLETYLTFSHPLKLRHRCCDEMPRQSPGSPATYQMHVVDARRLFRIGYGKYTTTSTSLETIYAAAS